jgi:hypothetical protein
MTSIGPPGSHASSRFWNEQVKTRKMEPPSRSFQDSTSSLYQRKVDMSVRSAVAVLLCCASLVVAQDRAKENLCRNGGQSTHGGDKDALDWAVGLSKRLHELHDPVVETYSLGVLGGIVCPVDRAAGIDIYREALESLEFLTPAAFTSAQHQLPVPSFTALWKSLTPAAVKCAPELQVLTDDERAQAKMQDERQRANLTLGDALASVHSNPDRAAQLARNALTTGDPTTLPIPSLALFLSALRDRAADLADEVFPEALKLVASSPQPSTANLSELGEYLFTAPNYREVPDLYQESELHQIGDTRIANFGANRKSTNPEDIRAYIDAAIEVLSATNDVYYDPVAGYAVAFQLLPKAEDFEPDQTDKLRKLVSLTLVQAGSAAAKVQEALAGSHFADQAGGSGPSLRDRMVSRILSTTTAGRFAEARNLTTSIGDAAVSSQVNTLIDFAQAASGLGNKELSLAFAMAKSLKPGVKPALLYAGAVAAAHDANSALGYFQLGLRDAEVLPAEQRLTVTVALAAVMLPRDQENGLFGLRQVVEAANEAYMTPHEGRFDPQVIYKFYSADSTTATDSSLVIANSRCTCEVVDTRFGRHNFNLKVPGVTTLTLSGLIRNVLGIDPRQLESVLMGLQDEQRLASALDDLAALRLRQCASKRSPYAAHIGR